MSNLDNIVNKAKNLVGVASKKTGEIFEVSKFKINKINKSAELQKNYELLGKLFFLKIFDSNSEILSDGIITVESSENMKSIINNIKKIQTEINELNDELVAIKNIKICQNCGNKNNKKALYCNICGNQLFSYSDDENNFNNLENFENSENQIFDIKKNNKNNIEIEKDYLTNKITESDICNSESVGFSEIENLEKNAETQLEDLNKS